MRTVEREYVEGEYRYRIIEEETEQPQVEEKVRKDLIKISLGLNPKLRDVQTKGDADNDKEGQLADH